MKKNFFNYMLILLLLLAAGCSGQVFKTLVDAGADSVGPTVVSVTSTAIDSIRVEYSEDVDPATAVDLSNYDVPGLALYDAAATANPRVIRLTTDYQYFMLYDITISSAVEDLNDNPMESDFSGSFQGAVEEPRIANVNAVKVDQVVVEFSEDVTGPVSDTASYKLYPSLAISSVDFPYGPGPDSIFARLNLSDEMQDTNYTLEITGAIQDLAGYDMHPLYSEQSFAGDARPRVAMISSASTTSIRLKFTEEVDPATVVLGSATYTITQVTGGAGTLTPNAATIDSADGSIVIITHNEVQAQESYQVVISGVQDLNGNAVDAGTSGYFFGNGPPSLASAASSGPNRVVVTYSEPLYDVDDAKTIDFNNYSIAGLSVTAAAWPGGDPGDRTIVELTTSAQLQDIYTVVLVPDQLRAADDQAYISAGSNAASFQGDGVPYVVAAVSLDPNQVKVIFSEDVEQTSAQNTYNYAITSTGYPSLSITGAARNPTPNANEVVLTTSTQLYVNYTVTVNNVRDITGNTIAGNNSVDFAGTGTDNTPPDLISVTSVSTTKIRVYFNEAVDEGTAGDELNYEVSNLSTATLTVSGQPSLNDALTISVPNSSTGSNSVAVVAGDAENLGAGVFNRLASTNELIAYSIVSAINADSLSPVRAYVNGNLVELVSRTYGADGDITVTNGLTNVTYTETASTTVNPAPGGASRSIGNYAQVDLTFSIGLAGMYELRVTGIADLAVPANYITTASKTVVVRGSDTAPPQLKGVYAPDATHVHLLFDEPVDFLTANKLANYAIEREIASFQVTTGTQSGDYTLGIYYDGLPAPYTMTAGADEDIPNDIFDRANQATTAVNVTRVMNQSPNSPVYGHAIGSTVYIARKTPKVGTIDNVVSLLDPFTGSFVRTAATYGDNNRTVDSVARNESFPWEVILTLDTATPLSTTHFYGITATGVADMTTDINVVYGGTRVVLPISAENTTPASDTEPPEIVSATALSDGVVRVIFSESVEQTSAENESNYFISPSLGINSAVRSSTEDNVVILYTELQGALTYYLTVSGVTDMAVPPNAASGQSVSFTGMASVNVGNGPVGNTVNGIGNINNLSITAAKVYNNRLYVATLNKTSGDFITEVYASDTTGVYFTQVNYSGFAPPTTYNKQRQVRSLEIFNGMLWASTSDTPSEYANVYYTDGTPSPVHDWIWDTPTTAPTWGNTYTELLNYGISTPHLYITHGSYLSYRDSADTYIDVSNSWDGGSPAQMIAFGGRLYVGVDSGSGIKVFRSRGANVDFPQAASDFEQVLDADLAGHFGMDGYDDDDNVVDGDGHYPDSNNTAVIAMAVHKGYIYIGTSNTYGAQVWRSQDGLTWERVLDFGGGAQFGGLNDPANTRISAMKVNLNYLYAGTSNTTDGGEAWRSVDGVTWDQFGSNGFGSESYTEVSAMESFLGLVYFCMEDQSSGGAIFRSSN